MGVQTGTDKSTVLVKLEIHLGIHLDCTTVLFLENWYKSEGPEALYLCTVQYIRH